MVSQAVSATGTDTITLASGDVTLNKTGTADGSVAVSVPLGRKSSAVDDGQLFDATAP